MQQPGLLKFRSQLEEKSVKKESRNEFEGRIMKKYVDENPFSHHLKSRDDLISYIYENPLDLVTGKNTQGKLSIPINKDNRKKQLCKKMWKIFDAYVTENFPSKDDKSPRVPQLCMQDLKKLID